MAFVGNLKQLMALLLLCIITFAVLSPWAEAQVSCDDIYKQLSPCSGYVKTGGAVPADCCPALKTMVNSLKTKLDRQSACQLQQDQNTKRDSTKTRTALLLPTPPLPSTTADSATAVHDCRLRHRRSRLPTPPPPSATADSATTVHDCRLTRLQRTPNSRHLNFSVDTVEFYWEEFKKSFDWDDAKTTLVYNAWEMKAKIRYADYISRLRKNSRPVYISPEIWTKWNEVWNSEEGKKKTELAKKNRRGGVLNGVAQSTHTTGSTPHVKVAAQLEGQLGHYPSYYELFKHTHTKQHDGETFIVEKAKQIHEQVATQRDMLTGTGEQVDDNQLYYDVVGGHDKKRRIYGLGSYGCSIVNGSISDNTSDNMTPTSRPHDNATPASVQDEIQSLKATILLMQQRLDAIDGGRAGTSSSPPSQTD
nr:uncharacterized protein LOC109156624 [Ipomoea batatas]